MKDKLIGVYPLGNENIRLYLMSGQGGQFNLLPDDKGTATVKVGKDEKGYSKIIVSLMHEVTEISLWRAGCQYFHANDYARDNGSRLFVFEHRQMSEVTAIVGIFLEACWNDLKKAWKQCK